MSLLVRVHRDWECLKAIFLDFPTARPGVDACILKALVGVIGWFTSIWFSWSPWLWVKTSWDSLAPVLPVWPDY